MASAGSHDRANRRQPRTPPVGAQPVGDLPTDRTHPERGRAGVMRGGQGRIVQHAAPVVPPLGLALGPPEAVRGPGRARPRSADTPSASAPVRRPGGGRQGVTTGVEGTGAQPHRLQARGHHRVAGLEGPWALPPWGRHTPRPGRRGRRRLSPLARGPPPPGARASQPGLDAPGPAARSEDLEAHRLGRSPPRPQGVALDARPGLSTATQAAPAHAGAQLRPPASEARVDPRAPGGQAPGADREREDLGQERRETRITAGRGRTPLGGQALTRAATGGPVLHPDRHWRPRRWPTGGTPPPVWLDPCHEGRDRGPLELRLAGRPHWPRWPPRVRPMGAHRRLGHQHWVGQRGPGPPPTSTTPTGLAACPGPGACRRVGLRRFRGWKTGMPRLLGRLTPLGAQGGDRSSPALDLPPSGGHASRCGRVRSPCTCRPLLHGHMISFPPGHGQGVQ